MTTPPPEVTRCRPMVLDQFCRNCKRWSDHPEQTYHNVTRVVSTMSSRDEACAYMPISLAKTGKPQPNTPKIF